MFAVTFIVVAVSLVDGSELELFRWTRDAASGIARAEREGAQFMGADWLASVRIEARAV